VTQTPYNHYSLLRSIEDLFGLPHLGFAGQAGLTPFGSDLFAAAGTPTPAPTPTPTPTPAPPSAPVVCRAAHSGRVVGATEVRRHRSSATLTFTPRRDAQLTYQVHPAHRPLRSAGHRRLRACRPFSLALPKGHGSVRLSLRAGRSREARSVRY
jgi:hypothetical protein